MLYVFAVDGDFAVGHVVVARQEVHERRFAAAALPHEGYGLPALHGEVHAVKHLRVSVVTERNVFEFDFIFQSLDVFGVFDFLNSVGRFQYFVHALHGGHAFGNVVSGFGEVFDRLYDAVKDHHVEDKRRRVDGRTVRENQRAAIPEHQHDKGRAEKFAHGVGHRLPQGHADTGAAKFLRTFAEAIRHFLFGGEGLDNSHAAERLVELCHRFAPFSLRFERVLFEPPSQPSHAPHHQRHHDDGEHRELPTRVEQHGKVTANKDGVFHQHFERAGDRVFDFAHVAAHACYDVAFALIGEERKREGDDLVVHAHADIAHHAGAHRHHDAHRGEVAGRFEERGGDEEHAD